jgi:drug/metabolite transporter (DMT)-like permease
MTLGTVGCGLLLLIPVALIIPEAPVTCSGWLWSMGAGIFDAVGILLLYMAMTSGRLSLAAPVSALTSAALPVIFGMLTQGIPDPNIIAGLLLALAAVWLVFQNIETELNAKTTLSDLYLPLLSGVCLGMFLILMRTASPTAIVWPMIAVRCGGVAALLVLFRVPRLLAEKPLVLPWHPIALTSLLDVGGNGCYILAGQTGRMDVAAVLSSLYPGATVFMAWLLLKEKLSRQQFAGILVALAAIMLLVSQSQA